MNVPRRMFLPYLNDNVVNKSCSFKAFDIIKEDIIWEKSLVKIFIKDIL